MLRRPACFGFTARAAVTDAPGLLVSQSLLVRPVRRSSITNVVCQRQSVVVKKPVAPLRAVLRPPVLDATVRPPSFSARPKRHAVFRKHLAVSSQAVRPLLAA